MSVTKANRIIFFSKDDLSSGHHLKNAENLLIGLDVNSLSDINDIFEIYHIKLYFDNNLFLRTWDDNTKFAFVEKVAAVEPKLKELFLNIDDYKIIESLNELEFDYKKSFWMLFAFYQSFKKITKGVLLNILNDSFFSLGYILQQRAIVDYFNLEIREFLIEYSKTAELLLSKYEEVSESRSPDYYFPKSLSLNDKENIISKYIESDANLNYIRLIEKSRDSQQLKISPKTKLKAKKRAVELNKQLFSASNLHNTGVQITLAKNQISPVEVSNEELILKVSYSEDFIDLHKTPSSRFMLFKNLFEFTNNQGVVSLISKTRELIFFERFGVRSKNAYLDGFSFVRKAQLSQLQLLVFDHYLNQNESSIEKLINSFIDEIFVKYFGMVNLRFSTPSPNSTFLEKIRALAPEFESLLKQFRYYKEDGVIDLELIQLDSTPLNYGEVKSLLDKKYIYSNHNKVKLLQHHFFSDQSMIHYVEPFNERYSNFFDLITREEVKLEHFKSYQRDIIDNLLEEGYLFVDINNTVKINEFILIFILGILYDDEVVSYWHYSPEVRNVMDEMIQKGWFTVEDTLLSKPELSYFNFYLNKKEFTNGYDIRNKYLHGTNDSSDQQHQTDYYILLKLIILIIIKILDDLSLKRKAEKSELKEDGY